MERVININGGRNMSLSGTTITHTLPRKAPPPPAQFRMPERRSGAASTSRNCGLPLPWNWPPVQPQHGCIPARKKRRLVIDLCSTVMTRNRNQRRIHRQSMQLLILIRRNILVLSHQQLKLLQRPLYLTSQWLFLFCMMLMMVREVRVMVMVMVMVQILIP
jgi:hypothetical protein